MKAFLKTLREVLFPRNFTCDICGAETFGGNLCPECLKSLPLNDGNVCPVCGRRNVINEICMECKAQAPIVKAAVSPLVYEDGAIILISKFKNGSAYLKDYFADLIAEKLVRLPKPDCIAYTPMTKKAVKKRDYNQAELLAKSLSGKTGIPFLSDAVIKTKETKEQKSLSRKERMENFNGCFKVEKREEIKDKRVLLVDDVLTTGATSDSIAKKLLAAGARCVYLATVASVEFKPEKTIDFSSVV